MSEKDLGAPVPSTSAGFLPHPSEELRKPLVKYETADPYNQHRSDSQLVRVLHKAGVYSDAMKTKREVDSFLYPESAYTSQFAAAESICNDAAMKAMNAEIIRKYVEDDGLDEEEAISRAAVDMKPVIALKLKTLNPHYGEKKAAALRGVASHAKKPRSTKK